MRRKDMMKLFVTEYQKDPATGKEKRVATYIGPWYTMEKKQRLACAVWCGLAWVLGVAAFATAGFTPSWAQLCGYVAPWYILCLLPLFHLMLGSFKLLRLKAPFTAMDQSESVGYIRSSGVALAVLGGAWSIATVIFLLLNNRPMTLSQELLFLACGVVTTAVGLLVMLLVRKVKVLETPQAE